MTRTERTPRQGRLIAALIASIALVVGACQTTAPTARPTTVATPPPSATTASPTSVASSQPSVGPQPTIPQPVPPEGVPIAPDSARVDMVMPVFSNPTQVTNPLFPVSRQASVLLLGHVDGKPFRTEVTLLPFTRILDWQGQRVETVVSQYMAFLDGRITEIAYDYYAQADDGSVWYFGEDVSDFVDGSIVTTEGSWLTGKDGPAAMIMPGQPKVGDVYRTENLPGFVFEEVTVKAIDQALDGPLGPIPGGLLVSELHVDGTTEDKLFAPGYGEFRTEGGGDLEALGMGVPTDALNEPVPAGLTAMSGGALRVFDLAAAGNWTRAKAEVSDIQSAWVALPTSVVPKPLEPLVKQALDRLAAAVDARAAARTRNASIEVARLALDVQLRYRPVVDINVARADLWAAQVLVDAAAKEAASVNSDVFALDYLRDRFVSTLTAPQASRLNVPLGEMQAAVVDDDLPAIAAAAAELRRLFAELLPAS